MVYEKLFNSYTAKIKNKVIFVYISLFFFSCILKSYTFCGSMKRCILNFVFFFFFFFPQKFLSYITNLFFGGGNSSVKWYSLLNSRH